jgi:hypothetical protein
MNLDRLAGALSPMRSLLNQTESRKKRHSNRGDASQHARQYSSRMISPHKPPVNSTQHAGGQSEKYMDSANLRANGDDRGPSMGGMISPKAPPVDTLYYDPDIGKYVKCPTLRLSDSQHGRCNSASAMPSSQRLPNLESIMDPSVLAGRTSPQYGRHGSRYMDSSNPQMNGHNRGQSVNDMSSPQRPSAPYPAFFKTLDPTAVFRPQQQPRISASWALVSSVYRIPTSLNPTTAPGP